MAIGHQFARFLAVGAVGFIVDGGLLMAMMEGLELSPVAARLISFSAAVTVTWRLNRLWTFQCHASDRPLAEWRRYVTVNGLGGLVNLGVFAVLAGPIPGLGVSPLIAFTIASAVALVFNFLGSRSFAFQDTAAATARQGDPPPF